jgi:hypothetical protein
MLRQEPAEDRVAAVEWVVGHPREQTAIGLVSAGGGRMDMSLTELGQAVCEHLPWYAIACIGCGKPMRTRDLDATIGVCRANGCRVVYDAPPERRDALRRTLSWQPEDEGPVVTSESESEPETFDAPLQLALGDPRQPA